MYEYKYTYEQLIDYRGDFSKAHGMMPYVHTYTCNYKATWKIDYQSCCIQAIVLLECIVENRHS